MLADKLTELLDDTLEEVETLGDKLGELEEDDEADTETEFDSLADPLKDAETDLETDVVLEIVLARLGCFTNFGINVLDGVDVILTFPLALELLEFDDDLDELGVNVPDFVVVEDPLGVSVKDTDCRDDKDGFEDLEE